MGLAGVLDDRKLVLSGDRQDRVHVGHVAPQMHRHDGRGPVGDRRLDLPGSIWNVSGSVSTKTGRAYCKQHGVDRGDEGVGRYDHLVARLDADRRQRGEQAPVPLAVATQCFAPVRLA